MTTIPDSQQYTYNVGWSQSHQAFQGVCAEFPELHCLAASAEAALAAIQQEAETILQARIRANEILPPPLPRPAALPLHPAPPARTWRNRLIVALLLVLSFVVGLTASFWLDTSQKTQPELDASSI